jgi:hypothetical protein
MDQKVYEEFKREMLELIGRYEKKYNVSVQSITLIEPVDIDMIINRKDDD